jgi:CBS domain-containing protein
MAKRATKKAVKPATKRAAKSRRTIKRQKTRVLAHKGNGKAVARAHPAARARDVMTSKVITVRPDAEVRDVARLLVQKGISGVPVMSAEGDLLGIVSEGDLLRRSEIGSERDRSWWLRFFATPDTLAKEFVKSHALKVADVMTREVISVEPDTPLRDIATTLEDHRIKRVPVVRDGNLVGIVSRANLVQALASLPAAAGKPGRTSDESIRRAIEDNLREQTGGQDVINVVIQNGTVDLWGFVDSDAKKKAARVVAETTPGIRKVNDHLTVRHFVAGT